MRGRKTIPVDFKKIKGSFRPDRHGRTVSPSDEKPYPPSRLSKRGKQIFRHIVKRLDDLGLASRSYTESICLIAERTEEIEIFDRTLKKEGYFYKSDSGLQKAHPAIKAKEAASRHLHSLLTEFGLTGASAHKVLVKKKKTEPNEFEGF